ncbi:uncharacterized protein B0H18DRAFT_958993 [Fomitopsis serialis]|uniref:uncharacterized protein n=1 Tax=Fomitopsis serialis TaxID=139415 RepID=UPI00200870BB|nr:uncharacterized protein B0H18DRAFT_958993 [Neoantrodia serialis]KAH9916064.1 hypothetical protein B0H18DRAFT_958993 [Neoantrodia serialis]
MDSRIAVLLQNLLVLSRELRGYLLIRAFLCLRGPSQQHQQVKIGTSNQLLDLPRNCQLLGLFSLANEEDAQAKGFIVSGGGEGKHQLGAHLRGSRQCSTTRATTERTTLGRQCHACRNTARNQGQNITAHSAGMRTYEAECKHECGQDQGTEEHRPNKLEDCQRRVIHRWACEDAASAVSGSKKKDVANGRWSVAQLATSRKQAAEKEWSESRKWRNKVEGLVEAQEDADDCSRAQTTVHRALPPPTKFSCIDSTSSPSVPVVACAASPSHPPLADLSSHNQTKSLRSVDYLQQAHIRYDRPFIVYFDATTGFLHGEEKGKTTRAAKLFVKTYQKVEHPVLLKSLQHSTKQAHGKQTSHHNQAGYSPLQAVHRLQGTRCYGPGQAGGWVDSRHSGHWQYEKDLARANAKSNKARQLWKLGQLQDKSEAALLPIEKVYSKHRESAQNLEKHLDNMFNNLTKYPLNACWNKYAEMSSDLDVLKEQVKDLGDGLAVVGEHKYQFETPLTHRMLLEEQIQDMRRPSTEPVASNQCGGEQGMSPPS